jgi:hypothetical protein
MRAFQAEGSLDEDQSFAVVLYGFLMALQGIVRVAYGAKSEGDFDVPWVEFGATNLQGAARKIESFFVTSGHPDVVRESVQSGGELGRIGPAGFQDASRAFEAVMPFFEGLRALERHAEFLQHLGNGHTLVPEDAFLEEKSATRKANRFLPVTQTPHRRDQAVQRPRRLEISLTELCVLDAKGLLEGRPSAGLVSEGNQSGSKKTEAVSHERILGTD